MKKLIRFFTRLCEAYLPDAFVFCLILTLLVFALGMIFTSHTAFELVDFWGKEFWSLNIFSMQMIFILISGHMLATTPLMKRVLAQLTDRIHTESAALITLALFSAVACWINWGFGLIASGILALELGAKLKKVNFGLFVATAYSGFLIWHGGLSGSIPLKVAGNDEILQRVYPGLRLSLGQTIFSQTNITIIIVCLILMPILALWIQTDEKVEVNKEIVHHKKAEFKGFRDRVENWKGFNIIFFVIFLVFIMRSFLRGEGLDIDKVNWIFLFLAIFLHGGPKNFMYAVTDSFGYASDIAIQFPFYAGIMGLMQYSGLSELISRVLVNFANAHTLPLLTFLSGGLINFFIPSGGGQWVVQGPVILKTAHALGADPAKVVMALAWGDAWTNLVQPFFALPILAVARLQLKDMMGHCLVYMIFSGIVISGVFLFL